MDFLCFHRNKKMNEGRPGGLNMLMKSLRKVVTF